MVVVDDTKVSMAAMPKHSRWSLVVSTVSVGVVLVGGLVLVLLAAVHHVSPTGGGG